jgi:multiple antibiotic resistance protein
LSLVGDEAPILYQRLARRIAVSTVLFLVVIELLGAWLLRFFGVSLPVVQVSGGLIIAATAWTMLFENDANAAARDKHQEAANCMRKDEDLAGKIFYPFTFPITAGPGTLVVTMTLSAHVGETTLAGRVAAYGGIALAAAVLSVFVYFCYAYAPLLVKLVSEATVHGILRVIAFILMCIGVQIAWNGFSMLSMQLLGRQ